MFLVFSATFAFLMFSVALGIVT